MKPRTIAQMFAVVAFTMLYFYEDQFDYLMAAMLFAGIYYLTAMGKSVVKSYDSFVDLTSRSSNEKLGAILAQGFSIFILGYIVVEKLFLQQEYSTLAISLCLLSSILIFLIIKNKVMATAVPNRIIGIKNEKMYFLIENKEVYVEKAQLTGFRASPNMISLLSVDQEKEKFPGYNLSENQLLDLKRFIRTEFPNPEIEVTIINEISVT